jgi:hypothetical protein
MWVQQNNNSMFNYQKMFNQGKSGWWSNCTKHAFDS